MERFRDFPVDPSWVFNMVEAGKLGYAEARTELVRAGKGLTRRLADLECWHRDRCEIQVREREDAAQAAGRQVLLPFSKSITRMC